MPRRHNCALLNTRSLNGKGTLLSDIMIERNLDLLFLTETWQMPDDFIELNLLTPPGYSYLTKPPLTGRGGGLAVVFKNNYKMTKYDVLNVSSFECLSFKLAGPAPILILMIYRPPKHNSSFLSELTELLTLACAQHDIIIMLGDFNIHVDSDCNTAKDFLSVLDHFDVSQHGQMGISDHKLIVFGFPLPLVKPKTKTTISYHNLKSVTIDSFSVAIAASPLSSALNLLSPDEILSTYNETICNVLDDLAPLKTRTVPSAHSSPWFTPELRVMKAECRHK